MGFPSGSVAKNLPDIAGDAGLISGSKRSPGEENGNPLQYSCLGNPADRGAWQSTVYEVAEESKQQNYLIYSKLNLRPTIPAVCYLTDRNLGAFFDTLVSTTSHIQSPTKGFQFHLQNISWITSTSLHPKAITKGQVCKWILTWTRMTSF